MRNSSGASFYYTTDALGSVILLTDSAQGSAATYSYDSWGNTTATGVQAAANPWQYAGGYKDTATGYTKFGARYYDATTGRFTQADPSGQETNRYAYATCNPINNTDPTGLDTLDCILGVAGSVGALLVLAGAIFIVPETFFGSLVIAGAAVNTLIQSVKGLRSCGFI
jgi:RHS repeat-associated protein